MALHHTLVVFDRPLSGATIPGRSSRYFSESEVAAVRVEAYQKGADSARHFADQQMVDFRAEVQALQDGLFAKLASAESLVISQLQDSLPGLVMEIARRLLGGYEPPPDAVARLCGETLEQLYPETDNLELLVSPRDAAALEQLSPSWKDRYVGLRITASPALSSGDCQVRSRFGLTDARLSSKLATLERELATP
ncbi:MAG TPA: FliH/SctL family protein [Opitutaceae bacterium]|jgi:flagellar assembly protein FliH|nr:flagellar biosynthesis protein [Opitutaceae bacterium]HRE05776.1 FliH/SctL family protein [Opitutaceae bacterium]